MTNRSWAQQIATIQEKGYKAYLDGQSEVDNPYLSGYRNQNGAGGQFQRQRRLAWTTGFRLAKQEHKTCQR